MDAAPAAGLLPEEMRCLQDKLRGIILAGISEVVFSNYAELQGLLLAGLDNRSVASTNMNAASSRSHCIVTFHICRHHSTETSCHSKLQLVSAASVAAQHPCAWPPSTSCTTRPYTRYLSMAAVRYVQVQQAAAIVVSRFLRPAGNTRSVHTQHAVR